MSGSDFTPPEIVVQLSARLPILDLSVVNLTLYQSDIYYTSPHPPLAKARPRNIREVQDLVTAARGMGLSLATRGAGLSYSAGYIPFDARTIVVDMTGMDRIVEINAQDMYVRLDPGVTWAVLREALRPLGLTTPFWGTFSGLYATIGASLSQGAKFYGSASRGMSAESVLGLTLVTGTGEVLVTGSSASIENASPFFRNYGPDLTVGLFLGDSGAFGIKVGTTSFCFIPAATETAVCSYSFDDPVAQLRAHGADRLQTARHGMPGHGLRSRPVAECGK